jgi:hypothetical protein
MDEKTAEEIAQDYKAMGDSVDLINKLIAEEHDHGDDECNDCICRNVDHLALMIAKDYWTDEDMTAANAAIKAGRAYLAE